MAREKLAEIAEQVLRLSSADQTEVLISGSNQRLPPVSATYRWALWGKLI
jgi:hypothetical protein